jgi:hypothetical protein
MRLGHFASSYFLLELIPEHDEEEESALTVLRGLAPQYSTVLIRSRQIAVNIRRTDRFRSIEEIGHLVTSVALGDFH